MVSFVSPTIRRLETSSSDLAVFFCFEEMRPFRGIVSLLDWRLHGRLSRMMIEGFFTGEKNVPLLVLPNRLLARQYVLLIGLGERLEFGEHLYKEALFKAFEIHKSLRTKKPLFALPGRVEDAAEPEKAMEWFLEVYDCYTEEVDDVFLIEPVQSQKIMTPALERWRLRCLIPGFNVVQ